MEVHRSSQTQSTVFEPACDYHQGTIIGDPCLLPELADWIKAQDAIADEAIGLLVEFMDRAAGGDQFLESAARKARPAVKNDWRRASGNDRFHPFEIDFRFGLI